MEAPKQMVSLWNGEQQKLFGELRHTDVTCGTYARQGFTKFEAGNIFKRGSMWET